MNDSNYDTAEEVFGVEVDEVDRNTLDKSKRYAKLYDGKDTALGNPYKITFFWDDEIPKVSAAGWKFRVTNE